MAPEPADLARFRATLGRRFGLSFEDSRLEALSEVLERRGDGGRGGVPGYLDRLDSGAGAADELRVLAEELTVAETYFFRNPSQFEAFAGAVLPERRRAQAVTRRLRVLSAGCASGEEAYTLAMVLLGELDAGWDVSIRGVDVSPAAVRRATRARYTSWSLRETPAGVRDLWFRTEGRELVLDERVRTMVAFEERNLVEEDPAFWQRGWFDVVFCRNVLMYLTLEAARGVVARIARALAPGGFLFLGHAETLRGLSEDFALRHTHETFYYQRSETSAAGSVLIAPGTPRAGGGREAASPEPLAWADAWVETVRQASERIARLTSTTPRSPAEPTTVPGLGSAPLDVSDVSERAVQLLREERFAEARGLLGSLSGEEARRPPILLLRAVLATHGGDLREAARVARELLEQDETSAGAHYVMALCSEHAGDPNGAAASSLEAARLDPTFSMARLHLGLLARRLGDLETARRELSAALSLLEREDPLRVLLFGGGFRREALGALCRAELLACGGGP